MNGKSLLDELRKRGKVFLDPCPPTRTDLPPSPIKTIIEIIGNILKNKK